MRFLTSWVVGTALRDLARWEAAGMQLDVSINVSPVDFADPGFADNVAMLLRADRRGRQRASCSK